MKTRAHHILIWFFVAGLFLYAVSAGGQAPASPLRPGERDGREAPSADPQSRRLPASSGTAQPHTLRADAAAVAVVPPPFSEAVPVAELTLSESERLAAMRELYRPTQEKWLHIASRYKIEVDGSRYPEYEEELGSLLEHHRRMFQASGLATDPYAPGAAMVRTELSGLDAGDEEDWEAEYMRRYREAREAFWSRVAADHGQEYVEGAWTPK